MAEPRPQFRRAVLGLEHHASRHGLPLAVDVARLLDLDLFGMFVEEDGLLRMAGLPFVREFSALRGWRALDSGELARELRAAAASAQRLFAQAVKDLPTACAFDVFRGSMAEAIAAHARPDDIVILSAPAAAGDYSAGQFPQLIETALATSAAVLLIPRQIARQTGDVVAIATRPDDPSIRLAANIARAAKEELVIIELYEADEGSAKEREAAESVTRKPAGRVATSDPAMMIAAFRTERERLVVVTHGSVDPTLPSILASWRRVPVLVIAPGQRDRAIEPEGNA